MCWKNTCKSTCTGLSIRGVYSFFLHLPFHLQKQIHHFIYSHDNMIPHVSSNTYISYKNFLEYARKIIKNIYEFSCLYVMFRASFYIYSSSFKSKSTIPFLLVIIWFPIYLQIHIFYIKIILNYAIKIDYKYICIQVPIFHV